MTHQEQNFRKCWSQLLDQTDTRTHNVLQEVLCEDRRQCVVCYERNQKVFHWTTQKKINQRKFRCV